MSFGNSGLSGNVALKVAILLPSAEWCRECNTAVVQDGLFSAPRAMKLLKGEGPNAVFDGGKYRGSSLTNVADFDPSYLFWVFGKARAEIVFGHLGKDI